jgi:hypothetical protein
VHYVRLTSLIIHGMAAYKLGSRIVPLQAIANAAGVATVNKQCPNGYIWTLRHIGISGSGALSPTCSIYQNNNFICGSQTGNNDAADGSPMVVYDTDTVTITWNGCTVGAVLQATLLVDEDPKGG